MSSVPNIVTETSPLTKGVTIHVFTSSAGALSFAGHSLRIDVSKYIVEYLGAVGKGAAAIAARVTGSAPIANASSEGANQECDLRLVKFTCPTEGLSTLSRINWSTKEDTGPLKESDKTAIDDRMKGKNVLDAAAFPEVVFVPKGAPSLLSCLPPSGAGASNVEGEFLGDLTLKGVTKEVRCTTKLMPRMGAGVREDVLVIKCPIHQTAFGIKPFSLLGLLSVGDVVEVEVTIPTYLL